MTSTQRRSRRVGLVTAGAVCIAGAIGWRWSDVGKVIAGSVVTDGGAAAVDADGAMTSEQRRAAREQYGFEAEGRTRADLSPAEAAYELRDLEWSQSDLFELDQRPTGEAIEALAAGWSSQVSDPDGLLPPAERERFLRMFARHVVARAQSDAGEYVRLIEEGPQSPGATTKWNERPEEDHQVKKLFTYYLGKPVPSGTPREVLDSAWSELRVLGWLPKAVGVGDRGAQFIVEKVRSGGQLDAMGLERNVPAEKDYWKSIGFRYGMRFSKCSCSSVSAMLESGHSIDVVHAHAVLQLRDGRVVMLLSTWWRPTAQDGWLASLVQITSSKQAFTVW